MTPAETLKREQAKARRESLELALAQQLRAEKLDAGMVTQHQPFEDIGFRYDFAWPDADPILLVEVNGGIWTKGAHGRGSGIARDQEKLNRASARGWLVMHIGAEHIRDGRATQWIRQALEASGCR